jgi:hypothetical protein
VYWEQLAEHCQVDFEPVHEVGIMKDLHLEKVDFYEVVLFVLKEQLEGEIP